MSLCTVAELKANLGVGSLYSDPTLQEVCDAADEVLIPMLAQNRQFAIGHKNDGTVGYLYFENYIKNVFYVGQTVNIADAGAHWDGNKTVNSVDNYYITVTTDNVSDEPYHIFEPYATVSAPQNFDYADSKAVQTAALLIACDIWQAKQAPDGGMSVDGGALAYRPATLLIAKVRSLIAPYLSSGSMVG